MVKTEYIRIYRGRLETYGAILIVMYEQSAKVIIVPRRIIWSWYTGRWWVGCYIWYSVEGTDGP